jgi:hypothetical protein
MIRRIPARRWTGGSCDSLAKGDLTGEIFNQISRRRESHDGDIRRECYSIKNTKLRKEREEERESSALS